MKYAQNKNSHDINTAILCLMIIRSTNDYTGPISIVTGILNTFRNRDVYGLVDAKRLYDILKVLNIIIKKNDNDSDLIITEHIDHIEYKDIIYMCEHNISVNVFMRKMKIKQLKEQI